MISITCPQCGTAFSQSSRQPGKRFCSKKCQKASHLPPPKYAPRISGERAKELKELYAERTVSRADFALLHGIKEGALKSLICGASFKEATADVHLPDGPERFIAPSRNLRADWQTFCPAGHALTPDNIRTRVRNGRSSNSCVQCHRESQMLRNREKGVLPRLPAAYQTGGACNRGHVQTGENVRSNGKGCAACHREGQLQRYWQNPKASRTAALTWQQNNQDRRAAYLREWRKRPSAAQSRMRITGRIRKYGQTKDPEIAAYAHILLSDPCVYCGAPCQHIDHIQPLSRGGTHEWNNLTAACQPCNSSKYNRPLYIFLMERRENT